MLGRIKKTNFYKYLRVQKNIFSEGKLNGRAAILLGGEI